MFLSFRLEIQMMKHGNPVQIIFKKWDHFVDICKDLQKVGHYFKLQKLPVHTGKNMFLSAGSIGADLFFFTFATISWFISRARYAFRLERANFYRHMFGLVHLIHNSKQILFAPKNVPIVCFRYQWDCHSFWGFTRHFYSCQYLACQKRGKGE